MEHKTFKMELKELAESGEFLGMSSVFGSVDLGGDIVMPGAFTKSISDRGGKFPLLYGHKVNIGVSYVSEKAQFLECKGFLNLDIQPAKEVYSNMQHFKKHGMDFGMSFGFLPIGSKTKFKDGVRMLAEVKLFENTLTEFPMNESARVLNLKDIIDEVKSGRRFSAASRAKLLAHLEAMDAEKEEILALLEEGAADDGTPAEAAATKAVEPVDHSRAVLIVEQMRSMFRH